MDVCRVHYVKGFQIWVGSEAICGEFITGFLLSVFASFLEELRKEDSSMSKGEVKSRFEKRFEGAIRFPDAKPSPCDVFQF